MFEKKSLKNREMRIKFPEQPDKFMESEVDLHQALQVCSNNRLVAKWRNASGSRCWMSWFQSSTS